jgi:hypothetical protein
MADQIKTVIGQCQMPGIDLGDVEDIIHMAQQLCRRCLGQTDEFPLVVAGRIAARNLERGHDAVEGGAHLMAHYGEEVGFRLTCGNRLIAGLENRVFVFQPLRDIAQVGDQDGSIRADAAGNGHFDGEFLAALARGGHADPPGIDDPLFACCGHARHSGLVCRNMARWHDQLIQSSANRLVPGVAECLFGGLIVVNDPAIHPGNDHAIQRRADCCLQARGNPVGLIAFAFGAAVEIEDRAKQDKQKHEQRQRRPCDFLEQFGQRGAAIIGPVCVQVDHLNRHDLEVFAQLFKLGGHAGKRATKRAVIAIDQRCCRCQKPLQLRDHGRDCIFKVHAHEGRAGDEVIDPAVEKIKPFAKFRQDGILRRHGQINRCLKPHQIKLQLGQVPVDVVQRLFLKEAQLVAGLIGEDGQNDDGHNQQPEEGKTQVPGHAVRAVRAGVASLGNLDPVKLPDRPRIGLFGAIAGHIVKGVDQPNGAIVAGRHRLAIRQEGQQRCVACRIGHGQRNLIVVDRFCHDGLARRAHRCQQIGQQHAFISCDAFGPDRRGGKAVLGQRLQQGHVKLCHAIAVRVGNGPRDGQDDIAGWRGQPLGLGGVDCADRQGKCGDQRQKAQASSDD